MSKDTQKIAVMQAELDALERELAGIKATLDQVKALEARQTELIGSMWGSKTGLIQKLKLKLENEQYPVWRQPTAGYGSSSSIIVAIDDKWISTRSADGWGGIVRYKRDTGRKERARDDRDNVDVAMMLKIWEDWHK